MLTAKRLREVLNYDPATGAFTWLKPRGKRTDLVGKIAGHVSRGYWAIRVDYQLYQAHRLAWLYMHGRWPRGEVDHRNRRGIDNRWRNLRDATHQQNSRNSSIRSTNRSGVTGVAWCSQTNKWRANITANGKTHCLGRYCSVAVAAKIRRAAECKLFGRFSPLSENSHG